MNHGSEPQQRGLSRFCHETSEWNALICSIAFFIVFSAFGTVQNYATSSHGDEGAISLAILYIVLTFSNIAIPMLSSCIPPRWAMFLGSFTYAMYVGANIHEISYILYTAAALEGIGAALLWVAQGSFITKCSHEYARKYDLPHDSQLGYFNGLFWSWMIANQFVGNSLAALLFYFDISTTTVYIVFTALNVMGVCVFLFIRPFDSETQREDDPMTHNDSIQSSGDYHVIDGTVGVQRVDEEDMSASAQNKKESTSEIQHRILPSDIETIPFIDHKQMEDAKPVPVNVCSMLSLWRKKQQLVLIPFTLYSGISQAFEYGHFPAQINDDFHKFGALALFGAVDAVFSLLFGRMSDKIGRLPVLTVAFIAHGAVYVFFYAEWMINDDQTPKDSDELQQKWYYFLVLAALLGIGDAGVNTQLYALYASLLGEKAEVFANLKFWQSLAMTWGFLSSGVHEQWNIILITCFALLCSAALPLYFTSEVRRKAKPQRYQLSF